MISHLQALTNNKKSLDQPNSKPVTSDYKHIYEDGSEQVNSHGEIKIDSQNKQVNLPAQFSSCEAAMPSFQERAVVMDDQTDNHLPLLTVEMPLISDIDVLKSEIAKPSMNQIRILILHANANYDLANEGKSLFLQHKEFTVSLSGDRLLELSRNHPKFALGLRKIIDFIVPVVSKELLAQIDSNGKRSGDNDYEREINHYLYDMARKEYSRSYSVNYRVWPVCVSRKIAKINCYDPLLQWCFHLRKEFPDLVDNIKKTHIYLLNKRKRSPNLKRSSAQEDDTQSLQSQSDKSTNNRPRSKKIPDETNLNLGEIIISHHPYAHGKIPQGMDICLNCLAISNHRLHYQWYKDCKELQGETSKMLLLKNLRPDRMTGKKDFQYYCKVSNKYHAEQSLSTTVRLAPINDTTPFYAEDKVALLIANDRYECEDLGDLGSPTYDAAELTKKLQSMDFKVILVRNLSLKEMKAVIHAFCDMLSADSYALFFFAGHGLQNWRQTYLVPVDCSQECLTEQCISKEYVLELLQKRKTALNVLLIDACRKHLSESREKPEIISANMLHNTVFGYATTLFSSSFEPQRQKKEDTFDLKRPNSFFVKYLLEYICQDMCIQEVLFNVSKAWPSELSIEKKQNPVLEYSLSMPRKLSDPLLKPRASVLVPWTITQEETSIQLLEIKSIIILKTSDTKELYFNEIDIESFLVLKEAANIHGLEINIKLSAAHLEVLPAKGRNLNDLGSRTNEKIPLFQKKVFGIQNINSNRLEGDVLLSFNNRVIKKWDFSLKVQKITEIKKFLDRLSNVN